MAIDSKDEIGEVASAFNLMSERLEALYEAGRTSISTNCCSTMPIVAMR